LFIKPL